MNSRNILKADMLLLMLKKSFLPKGIMNTKTPFEKEIQNLTKNDN